MLKDPNVRLHEIEIALFSPYRPMLGDRGAPSKVKIVEKTNVGIFNLICLKVYMQVLQ